MNRFDRVTAIMIQLQSKKVVKAQELAERFEVSLRTIYRDIRSLEEAGIPLYGEAGVGYSMADGYRLPPVMFTKEEAMAFLTAEKLVEKLTDSETSKNYAAAMFKIRSILKTQEKDFLEQVEEKIIVRKQISPLRENADLNLLPTILQAIAKKEVLSIQYFSLYQQEITSRTVEPLGILFENNKWHMIAYCRLRSAYRDFRIDRINSLKITGDRFSNEHPTFAQYLDTLSREQNLHTCVIKMSKKTSTYIEQDRYYYGFVMEEEEGVFMRMTFLTQSIEGFARWLMMFGEQATIVQPEELKERVRDLALETLSLYPIILNH